MDSLHSHLNSAEGSKCLNFILSTFSVLERSTVTCPRGSFIENAMCNVNELGWVHTFFHTEPVQKQIRDSRRNSLQVSTDACHGVNLYFVAPPKTGRSITGALTQNAPMCLPRFVLGLSE